MTNLKALGPVRLASIGGVAIVILGLLAAITLRGNAQPMSLLYGDMDLRDAGQVASTLDKLHIPYETRGAGATILVPADEVDRARLALARDGLPSGGTVGYEVFDRGDSLMTNQFQQQINQLRALEGELSRTIRTIRGVRGARVHLVLGKREPFAREQQEAQASIVLAMAGAARMDNEEVQAIVNLVAAAVPGLKPQNISVVDNRGALLARPGSNGDGALRSNADVRRATEHRLEEAVETMLGRTLGADHVRAEATVQMDFDRLNETQEKFDPDNQVPRTQSNSSDTNKSTEAQQTVSVQNNLPNPDTQNNAATGTSSSHQEESTNFEIGKTIRTIVRDTPSIKRVSMAVLVDGISERGPNGKPAWRELTKPELARIEALVRSAIGFDQQRGDHVEVVNMKFSAAQEEADIAATEMLPWWQPGKSELRWLITIGVLAVVTLFALGVVVRPLALKLATALPGVQPALEPPALTAPGLPAPSLPVLPFGESAGLLPGLGADGGAANATLLTASPGANTMLNVANVQGPVRASSVEKLVSMVDTQPDESVTVIRNWLAQGAS